MVSDFFYPNVGGVEGHIYHLSQRLIQLGHRVVILTHNYKERTGVRYLSSGAKVYYIPHWLVTDQVSLPTVYSTLPLFRHIFIREQIDLMHGHQAFSAMCHEAILHARTMGIKVVFTDHSLFGFEDTASILTNKLLKFTLSDIDHVICVSHTSKENTVLRASLDPRIVSVIPNAIISQEFTPRKETMQGDRIASRLVYRKGADLLVNVIPQACERFPHVDFLIAGDGNKKVDLQQMREQYRLEDRVTLLGAVPHGQIRDVLIQGQIFLNTSLTEAFCIAIVEAASCGLLVVSTQVGGVPEVLPPDMILFAAPDPKDILKSIEQALDRLPGHSPKRQHQRVSKMYSWDDVAKRTDAVYTRAMQLENPTLAERFERYHTCGIVAGKFAVMIMAVNYMLYVLLEWLNPRTRIPKAYKFDLDKFHKELGNAKSFSVTSSTPKKSPI